ncbi:MAG: phosphodiesterase/alkaline phosphatase [Bacteroidota bacterium]|nr:phosphodiesterase/alkaline phosphatase [Bacteroidota bacterium]
MRMPGFELKSPATLADQRNRHKYYLLDPDLRFARQNKMWIVEWDNHDTHFKEREKTMDGITAFYEYVPIRMPDTSHPENVYRSFHFGQLAQLDMIDMYLFRGKEQFAPGKGSVLGAVQDQWIKNQLQHSTAQWHLLGNQEMMGSWLSKGIPKFLHA